MSAVEELRTAFGPATPGSTPHVAVDEQTPGRDRWLSLAWPDDPVALGTTAHQGNDQRDWPVAPGGGQARTGRRDRRPVAQLGGRQQDAGVEALAAIAPELVAVAHRIVWATVATVDEGCRPRTRILHPIWQWDGDSLVGWIATGPTPLKRRHLDAHPDVSLSYWDPGHDTVSAECRATWHLDDETRSWLWDHFKNAPEPVGYDPAVVAPWSAGPTSPAFAALRLDPWRLRVQPAAAMTGDGAALVLRWTAGG